MKKTFIIFIIFLLMILVVGCVNNEIEIDEGDVVISFEEPELNLSLGDIEILPLELENISFGDLDLEYDEEIITLDMDVVIPLAVGQTTLTASYGEITSSVVINVTGFLKANRTLLELGQNVRIDLVGFSSRNHFTWEVDNEEVIKFENYIAYGIKPGTATITVRNINNPSIVDYITIDVILNSPILISTINTLRVGDQTQMLISNLEEINKNHEDYNWIISDETILSLDENYLVTALSVGSATVTASLKEDPKSSKSFEFNVVTPTSNKDSNNEPAEGPLIFEVENPYGIVQAGEALDIKIVGGNDNYNYYWRVDDMAVVQATDQGVINGFKEGRTKVTVVSKNNDDIRGEFYVTVVGEPNVNYIDKLVSIALSEEGYMEGVNKQNKYGEWYEYDRIDWCAIFVSWAANQAGIGTNVIPKYALVSEGLRFFDEQGLFFESGKDYIPKKGDIVFFSSRGDVRIPTHTGIVTHVDEEHVYTVEGNINLTSSVMSEVITRAFKFDANYIVGYGTPLYPEYTE